MGAGGIGVSALARYAKLSGASVTGCDQNESSGMLEALRKEGIGVLSESSVNPKDFELIVRSNAVPLTHRVLREAKESGIPVLRRGDVLAAILTERSSIAITGSHGKTTMTFLIGHLLSEAGLSPTIYGGGIDLGSQTNFMPGTGKWLIAEMDESDRTFVAASPEVTVITNLELEHVDQYPTLAKQVEAFEEYVGGLRKDSFLVVNGDDKTVRRICESGFHGAKRVFCGREKSNEYVLLKSAQGLQGMKITLGHEGREITLESPLFGEHNGHNMLMAYATARLLGVPEKTLQEGFKKYKGVRRRFEMLKPLKNGGALITDYGHHPTEIAAVLKAARNRNPKAPLIAVFEAHRCSRLKTLMDEFVETFRLADFVVISDIYTAGETADVKGLIKELSSRIGPERSVYIENGKIMNEVLGKYISGESVILFSAGTLDSLAREAVHG